MSTKNAVNSNQVFKLMLGLALCVIVVIYALLNGIEMRGLIDFITMVINAVVTTNLNVDPSTTTCGFVSAGVPMYLLPGDTLKLSYFFKRQSDFFWGFLTKTASKRARLCLKDMIRVFRAINLQAGDTNWCTLQEEIRLWNIADFVDPQTQRDFRRLARGIRVVG